MVVQLLCMCIWPLKPLRFKIYNLKWSWVSSNCACLHYIHFEWEFCRVKEPSNTTDKETNLNKWMKKHSKSRYFYTKHVGSTQLNTYGRFWSNVLGSALHYHHQTRNEGISLRRMLFTLPETTRIYDLWHVMLAFYLSALSPDFPTQNYILKGHGMFRRQ